MIRSHGKAPCICAAVLFLLACSVDAPDSDPRIGDNERVRFSGGGGCSSSTTLALGATGELTIEPVDTEASLPEQLGARSSAPDIVELLGFAQNRNLTLKAQRIGEAEIQLIQGDDIYDSLTFDAEPAASLTYSAPSVSFSGAKIFLKIEDVYGACGEDCPLIGGGFLSWESDADQNLMVLRDTADRTPYFSSSHLGPLTIIGKEPSTGKVLVTHELTLVDPAEIQSLVLGVLVLSDEGELVELPGPNVEIPLGGQFIVTAHAITSNDSHIPIAGPDIHWSFQGDTAVATKIADTENLPEGGAFEATRIGSGILAGALNFLDSTLQVSIELTVIEN